MIKGLKEQIEITERKIKQLEDKMTPDVHFSLIDKLELEYCQNNLKYLKALYVIKGKIIWVENDKLMCGRYGDTELELEEEDFENREEFDLLKEVLCNEAKTE